MRHLWPLVLLWLACDAQPLWHTEREPLTLADVVGRCYAIAEDITGNPGCVDMLQAVPALEVQDVYLGAEDDLRRLVPVQQWSRDGDYLCLRIPDDGVPRTVWAVIYCTASEQ